MAVIGEAFVRVSPDGTGFSGKAEASLVSGMGSLAKKAAGAFIAGFVIDKALDGFRDSIGLASDLSESMNKVDVVFGSAAKSVRSFAADAPLALGQTEAQALAATGTFGNLLRSVGLTEAQSAKFSTTMVGLASDLASFNNTDPAEALDALRAGLVGETEPLKRYGVNLNDATLKAKAMTLGLYKGKGQLDANAKAQAAYALIMEQTSLAQGDFARTSGGLANQQRILKAQTDQAKAAFGAGLLPVLEKLTPVLSGILAGAEPLASSLGSGLATALGAGIDGLDRLYDVANRLVRFMREGVAFGFVEAITRLLDLGGDWETVARLQVVFDDVRGAMARATDAVAPLVAAIGPDGLGTTIFGLIGNWQALASEGLEVALDAYDRTADGVDKLTGFMRDQQDVLVPLAAGFASFAATLALVKGGTDALATIKSVVAGLGPALAPLLANPVGLFVAGLVAVGVGLFVAYKKVKPFRDAVDGLARTVRDVALTAFDTLRNVAGAALDGLRAGVDAVVPVLRSMLDGVRSGIDTVREFFGGLVDSAGRVASRVIVAMQPLLDWVDANLLTTFRAAGDFLDALGDRLRNVGEVAGRLAQAGFAVLRGQLQAVAAVARFTAGIVSDVLGAAFRVLRPIVETVLGVIGNNMRTTARVAGQVLGTAFDALLAVGKVAFYGIKAVVETVLGVLRGTFTFFAGILRGDFGKAWSGLVEIVQAPVEAIGKFVRSSFSAILDFVGTLPGRLASIAGALWQGLLDNTTTILDGLAATVQAAFSATLDFVAGLPGRVATLASGLWDSIVTSAEALPGRVSDVLAALPGMLLDLGGQLLEAGVGLGEAILQGLLAGLGAVGDRVGEFASDLWTAIRGLGEGIVNGVIDALNDLLPDKIGAIKVRGVTIFDGLDLPDDPIPHVKFATGGWVRQRPGGVRAVLGEAGYDELVLSSDPRYRARNRQMLEASGFLNDLRAARPGGAAAVAGGRQLVVQVQPGGVQLLAPVSPQQHAQAFFDGIATEAWLQGAA